MSFLTDMTAPGTGLRRSRCASCGATVIQTRHGVWEDWDPYPVHDGVEFAEACVLGRQLGRVEIRPAGGVLIMTGVPPYEPRPGVTWLCRHVCGAPRIGGDRHDAEPAAEPETGQDLSFLPLVDTGEDGGGDPWAAAETISEEDER